MADVARLAGVSVTTVSHVINGTRPASERTRDSVLAAIERTGYRPNTIARALARGGTQSLGLAISGLSNPYFMDVVAAVEAAAGRAGHTLLLGDTREDPEHELRIVRALAERQVDGMLLAPTVGRARARAALPRVARACRSSCSTASSTSRSTRSAATTSSRRRGSSST